MPNAGRRICIQSVKTVQQSAKALRRIVPTVVKLASILTACYTTTQSLIHATMNRKHENTSQIKILDRHQHHWANDTTRFTLQLRVSHL